MRNAKQILDLQFLEMRWRCVSLAADLDRLQQAPDGTQVLRTDDRLASLRRAFNVLLDENPQRARRVQMLFSDQTPLPPR